MGYRCECLEEGPILQGLLTNSIWSETKVDDLVYHDFPDRICDHNHNRCGIDVSMTT